MQRSEQMVYTAFDEGVRVGRAPFGVLGVDPRRVWRD
jgi:hypothetical protein